MAIGVGFGTIVIVAILIILMAFRVLREYQRAVVFMLGRFWKVKGPGFFLLIPAIQQMVRIDLRTVVMDVPPQDVITRDNVSVKVNAVVYFRIVDPAKAVIQVENYYQATSQLAQTTLRAVLGKHELDELLAAREKLNLDIQQVLDSQTEAWGIDDPRDRAPGRGRARAPRQDHSRRRRAAGVGKTAAGGADALEATAGHAASLFADIGQYCRRQELDHRFPAADRSAERPGERQAPGDPRGLIGPNRPGPSSAPQSATPSSGGT
jgi:hypothetical protein